MLLRQWHLSFTASPSDSNGTEGKMNWLTASRILLRWFFNPCFQNHYFINPQSFSQVSFTCFSNSTPCIATVRTKDHDLRWRKCHILGLDVYQNAKQVQLRICTSNRLSSCWNKCTVSTLSHVELSKGSLHKVGQLKSYDGFDTTKVQFARYMVLSNDKVLFDCDIHVRSKHNAVDAVACPSK